MFTSSVLAVALAGAAMAVTPPGFEPSSNKDLAVAFDGKLALNGAVVSKAECASAPTVGTAEKMEGKYTIMMVDSDIPPAQVGGPTSELLHWMQTDLQSADTATNIGGMQVFELVNAGNTTAFASYLSPNPPNKAPLSHRYTQMLLNTTTLQTSGNMSILQMFASSRQMFDAAKVVKMAGLEVLAANSFNVTAGANGGNSSSAGATTGPSKSGAATATATATGAGTGTGTGKMNATSTSTGAIGSSTTKSTGAANLAQGGSTFIAGLGAFAAAVILF